MGSCEGLCPESPAPHGPQALDWMAAKREKSVGGELTQQQTVLQRGPPSQFHPRGHEGNGQLGNRERRLERNLCILGGESQKKRDEGETKAENWIQEERGGKRKHVGGKRNRAE